jgi:hypothetical protein
MLKLDILGFEGGLEGGGFVAGRKVTYGQQNICLIPSAFT